MIMERGPIWTGWRNVLYRRQYLVVVVLACLGITLSVISFKFVLGQEEHKQRVAFEHAAATATGALKHSLHMNMMVLQSVISLYAASNTVHRDEFHKFVSPILSQRKSLHALEWIPRIPHAERAKYEAAARNEGYPDFRIVQQEGQGAMTPAARDQEHFPVYYVEPYAGNEKALGFDLASNPARLAALEKARDSGMPIVTGRITLVQETEDQYGFLVFWPVYRNGAPKETLDERRGNLTGFILGVFRVGDLVAQTVKRANLENLTPHIEISLYDRSAPPSKQALIVTHSNNQSAVEASPPFRFERNLKVGERNWEVVVTSHPLSAWLFWEAWAALVVGLLLTSLLSAYILASLRRTASVERLVAQRTQELREESLAKSQILSTVTHELKTPLTTIVGYVDRLLLRRDTVGLLNERQQRYLENVQEESRRLKTLIDDLLDISRIEAGSLQLTLAELEVRVEIDQALHTVQNQFTEKRILTERDIPPDLSPITANQLRFSQIVINLLTNAHKYSPEGAKLIVTAKECAGVVQIDVADTGMGISKADQARLFTKFFRADNTATRNESGTGLGLFITRHLVEAQGGKIWVESREGKGSTFSFTVPRSNGNPIQKVEAGAEEVPMIADQGHRSGVDRPVPGLVVMDGAEK